MGKVISSLVADEKEMEIVAGIDVSDCVEDAYPVFKSLEECSTDADVVIDFSNAKGDGCPFGCVRVQKASLCAVYDRTFGRAAFPCTGGGQKDSDTAFGEYVRWYQSFTEAFASGGTRSCGSGI